MTDLGEEKFGFRKVAIGCDHAAVDLKNEIASHMRSKGIHVEDLGVHTKDRVDYPDIAVAVCKLIQSKEVEAGVLLCGTGIGMSLAANKCRGIRAAVCHDYYTASMCREHNDANVLCAGARVTGVDVVKQMVDKFVSTPFENAGRHPHRVQKINALEVTEGIAAAHSPEATPSCK
jgi:ribose 5-phosphate isomerase B